MVNSTKNEGNSFQCSKTIIQFSKAITRVIAKQPKFLCRNCISFLLLVKINENVNRHSGQSYVCLSVTAIG